MPTRINIADLAEIVQDCFHRSLDGRLAPAQRAQFLDLGERLNDRLSDAAARTFDDSTAAFKTANDQLTAINTRLKSEVDSLDAVAATLGDITKLVGVVDTLLAGAMAVL